MLRSLLLLPFFLYSFAFANCVEYQKKPAQEKLDYLYKKVLDSKYSLLNVLLYDAGIVKGIGLGLTNLLDDKFLKPSFDHTCDEMPEGRVKLIHSIGNVGKVLLKVTHETKEKYSGVFTKGTEIKGLARLSLAMPSPAPFTPGMALKFLIDGRPSLNILAMNSLDGQESKNFFEKTFTNDIPEPDVANADPFKQKMFAAFEKAIKSFSSKNRPTYLPLTDWAKVTADGKDVAAADVSAPHAFVFVPTSEAKKSQEGYSFLTLLRKKLQKIKRGTKLYDVKIVHNKGDEPEDFGELYLLDEKDNRFQYSSFGDKKLFFQHPVIKK